MKASKDLSYKRVNSLSVDNNKYPYVRVKDGRTELVNSDGTTKVLRTGVRKIQSQRSNRSCINDYATCLNELDLKGLLNVSEFIDSRIKGLPTVGSYNEQELRCAKKIVTLYNRNKGKAVGVISDLNHRIVVENRKGLNVGEGKKLLRDLMDE